MMSGMRPQQRQTCRNSNTIGCLDSICPCRGDAAPASPAVAPVIEEGAAAETIAEAVLDGYGLSLVTVDYCNHFGMAAVVA